MKLPPDDPTTSSFTGYTREHWLAAADALLEAVVPYAAPGFAQIRLPGPASASGPVLDGLEGFARTFLLAAFRGRDDLLERYARGLDTGTDPNSPYAWPAITDNSQQIVEAASVALALHESGLYTHLSPAVQERVAGWLGGISGKRAWPCNWVLFKVIVQQFLANVGAPHRPDEIEEALAQVEGWYVGDGWYNDGDGQNYDYYCGWAMHLYTLWYTRMSGAPADVYRERLRAFLAGYQHFFGSDGAPVHQGRSLTYRFAAATPLWLGEIFDATPLSPGTTRRLASGTLRHFLDRGAVGPDGLLSLGWHGPYLPVTQPYSGPGSPYWASKGFLGLLLPADHPVWTAAEEPAPVDTADQVVALPAPGWLLHSTRRDGIVRLLNHGSDRLPQPPAPIHDDPHYARLAYATHAAPVVDGPGPWTPRRAPEPTGTTAAAEAADVGAIDNRVTVIAPDGTASRRGRIQRIAVTDRFAASRATDDALPATVESASIVYGPHEIRVHRVTAPAGHTVREGGYAVPGDGPATAITPLHGWLRTGVSTADTAFGPDARTPYLETDHPGGTMLLAGVVTLGHGTLTCDLRADADGCAITFPDGERVEIRLGDHPRYTRQAPDGTTVTWEPA
ncbi:DUF2264 domain-containing protein [Nonomuraea jiangxiensis]|uniref:DUF2264 domain-containing protein n=1 Tax=Nonomuraea jiangxiensis TaxID=633440 RepID=A0A1G9ASZ7_9ACTN|nr:DUF2264 domain-containing protein [Nonomuraea jiangxiensis]SDK29984.1 hypothetical protein SAMN05421869_11535 [Nonomuraea jiangxiensis]